MGQWLRTYEEKAPALRLDGLCGCGYWKALLKSCVPDPDLDAYFGVGRTHAFLLCGPAGVGKTTLARALAGELGAVGYRFAAVPGEALKGESEEEDCERIGELFLELEEAAASGETGWCLLLDDLTPLAEEKRAMRVLCMKLQGMAQAGLPFTAAATAESLALFPAFLDKYMIPCRISPPDEQERREYLEDMFERRIHRESGLSYDWMVKQTEGFTYRELSDLSKLAGMLMKQKALDLFGHRRDLMAEALKTGKISMTKDLFIQMTERLEERMSALGLPSGQRENDGKELKAFSQGSEERHGAEDGVLPDEEELDFMESLNMDIEDL